MQISHSFVIPTINQFLVEGIRDIIAQKTKPPGSLGQLETLAEQMALIQSSEYILLNRPTMLVFAGDHGIAEEGISIAPSEVTSQMVGNFIEGGAAINCFCETAGMDLLVVDAGIANPLNDKRIIDRSMGPGTANFSKQKAMSLAHAEYAIETGAQMVEDIADEGCTVFGFGEMGIGNTSSASAIMAAITGLPVSQCVGKGTGIDDETLSRKKELIEQALQLHADDLASPIEILAAVGGYEIAQMTGAMLAAAQCRCIIIVDGFIATAAALVASKIDPKVRSYMVFSHQSEELGHRLMLEYLEAKPLLHMGMRLGEGTGAALAFPLLKAAASFFNDMASFQEANVSEV